MRPAEFWCSTIPEINSFLIGSREAQRDALDLVKTGAWLAAVLPSQKRIPELAEFLARPEKRRRPPQTKDEVIATWKAHFARIRVA